MLVDKYLFRGHNAHLLLFLLKKPKIKNFKAAVNNEPFSSNYNCHFLRYNYR